LNALTILKVKFSRYNYAYNPTNHPHTTHVTQYAFIRTQSQIHNACAYTTRTYIRKHTHAHTRMHAHNKHTHYTPDVLRMTGAHFALTSTTKEAPQFK